MTGGNVAGGLVVGGFVTGGFVAGGFVTGGFVTGVVDAGTVGGGFVAGGSVAGTDVGGGTTDEARVVVVVLVGVFGGTVVVVFEAKTASAMPATSRTTTIGRTILVHNGHDRSRRAEPPPVAADVAGRTAVWSCGTTGTGSVGSSNSGGYQRPSAPRHHPGSSGW